MATGSAASAAVGGDGIVDDRGDNCCEPGPPAGRHSVQNPEFEPASQTYRRP